jgi:hypothetical protein
MEQDKGKCVGCGETAGTANYKIFLDETDKVGRSMVLCDRCADFLSAERA